MRSSCLATRNRDRQRRQQRLSETDRVISNMQQRLPDSVRRRQALGNGRERASTFLPYAKQWLRPQAHVEAMILRDKLEHMKSLAGMPGPLEKCQQESKQIEETIRSFGSCQGCLSH